ncbi:hypothetical protein ACQKLX_22390 [Bosea sp. NPDC003192]|jgi:hypothetical protein
MRAVEIGDRRIGDEFKHRSQAAGVCVQAQAPEIIAAPSGC